MLIDENAYNAANHARIQQGLRPFDGIEEFRRGLDYEAIEQKRSEIEAAEAKLESCRESNDEGDRALIPTLEKGVAALHVELWALGGSRV